MKEESPGHFLNGFGIFGPSLIQPRSFRTKIGQVLVPVSSLCPNHQYQDHDKVLTISWKVFLRPLPAGLRILEKVPKILLVFESENLSCFTVSFDTIIPGFRLIPGSSEKSRGRGKQACTVPRWVYYSVRIFPCGIQFYR